MPQILLRHIEILLVISATLFSFTSAEAKSSVTFTDDEMIIDLRLGPPVIEGTIDGETYRFLISTATSHLSVTPEIGNRHVDPILNLPLGLGDSTIDYVKVKRRFGRVKIDFEGGITKSQNAYWFKKDAGVPYEGFDGVIDAFNFKKKTVTFILSDPQDKELIKSEPFKSARKLAWGQRKKNFINDKNVQLSFRPHYDKTRITIGAAYALEYDDNIEYEKEVFIQPRDFIGPQEYVRGRLKTPLFPLHNDRPLQEVDVHILKGSFDPTATPIAEDEVVVTAKSDRKYTRVIWLGKDFFDGCEKIEFIPKKKTMTTYCYAD